MVFQSFPPRRCSCRAVTFRDRGRFSRECPFLRLQAILSRRLAERLPELALVGLHEWSKFPEDCANLLAMSLSSLELLWWRVFIERNLHYVVHVPVLLIVVLFKVEALVSSSVLHHLHACEVWTRAIFRQLTELLSADASWAVGRPGSLSGSLRPVHSASLWRHCELVWRGLSD